jgi:hypothetical protein
MSERWILAFPVAADNGAGTKRILRRSAGRPPVPGDELPAPRRKKKEYSAAT